MVKPITIYVTQKSVLWYGHVLTRDDTNVAKDITTMNVGGKRPRGRPRLRWMDRVQSDMGGKRPRGRPRLRWVDRVRSDMGGKRPRGRPRLRWMDRVRSDMGGKTPRWRPRLRWMDRVRSDVGGKRPRGRPRLRWMDRVRSDMGGKTPRWRPRLRWMDRVRSDVGGKTPRWRPRLRWMDRVRSDLKEHQIDPKPSFTRYIARRQSMCCHRWRPGYAIYRGTTMLFLTNAYKHACMPGHVCACMCVLAYGHLIQLLQSQTRIS